MPDRHACRARRARRPVLRPLRAVTQESAWEQWVLYILTGIERTSLATFHKIAAIRELQDDFARRGRAVSRGGADSEFQSVLLEQPYCRISTVMTRCGVSRPTATSWLGAFAEAGLLQDIKVGRDRLFVNREFLQLLVRADPSTNGLPTDGRQGRHLHVSIPAGCGVSDHVIPHGDDVRGVPVWSSNRIRLVLTQRGR